MLTISRVAECSALPGDCLDLQSTDVTFGVSLWHVGIAARFIGTSSSLCPCHSFLSFTITTCSLGLGLSIKGRTNVSTSIITTWQCQAREPIFNNSTDLGHLLKSSHNQVGFARRKSKMNQESTKHLPGKGRVPLAIQSSYTDKSNSIIQFYASSE